MSVRKNEIIAATTEEVTSHKFTGDGTKSVTCGELAAGETVTLQYTHDGTEFKTLRLNGSDQVIDENHSILTINGPGSYRVIKSATAAAVSVCLWETEAEQ
jgi:hypothetical protein